MIRLHGNFIYKSLKLLGGSRQDKTIVRYSINSTGNIVSGLIYRIILIN